MAGADGVTDAGDLTGSSRASTDEGQRSPTRPASRSRPGTVVPIIGARRLEHLTWNLAGLDVALTDAQTARLDDASAPALSYPASLNGDMATMLQFAGATVDGRPSGVYPPLLASDVRY
jgi:hypothetical protein